MQKKRSVHQAKQCPGYTAVQSGNRTQNMDGGSANHAGKPKKTGFGFCDRVKPASSIFCTTNGHEVKHCAIFFFSST